MSAYLPGTFIETPTADGVTIEYRHYRPPNGPQVRVRDGWRDESRLPPDVMKERAIILEQMIAGQGWQEIATETYLRFSREDDGKVGHQVAPLFRRAELRTNMIERGKRHIVSLVELAFC